jgi:hypothetical protein
MTTLENVIVVVLFGGLAVLALVNLWRLVFGPQSNPKQAAGLVFLFVAASVGAFYCPQYQDSMVSPNFTLHDQSIEAEIKAVDTSLKETMNDYHEKIMDAIKALTKQKALGANQVSDATRLTAQQTAAGLSVLDQTERVKAARLEYGPEFGQGYDPCGVLTARTGIAARSDEMGSEARARVAKEVVAAPGVYLDRTQGREALIASHQPFCSQDDVDSGLCQSVGELPAADLNAATLYEPAMGGETLYDAKSALINHMVGVPDGPVPAGAGKSSATEAYSLAKDERDAVRSPAIAALKELQVRYSGVNSAEGGTDLPIITRYENEVGRYVGDNPENLLWAKVLAAQKTRGLLVELNKVRALQLAIHGEEYKAMERTEALLAGLVAAEWRSSGAAGASKEGAQRAATDATGGVIK